MAAQQPAVIRVQPITQPIVLAEAESTPERSLGEAVRAAGGQPINVTTPAAFVAALEQFFPMLALVDLNLPGDWASAIRRSKLLPHTRTIPIHAHAVQADGEGWQVVQRAGADQLWQWSELLTVWPTLIQQHLHPPISYPVGWDAPLSELARQGLMELNHRRYFEQHEYLEAAWNSEARPIRNMYQGILQAGVAFLQIERNNWAGAVKLLRRALPRLRPLPAVCQGVQIGKFRTAVEMIHAEISQLGPGRLADFDQQGFPQIEFEDVV
jgi:hypothetical protein